jgi:hypothetical protein
VLPDSRGSRREQRFELIASSLLDCKMAGVRGDRIERIGALIEKPIASSFRVFIFQRVAFARFESRAVFRKSINAEVRIHEAAQGYNQTQPADNQRPPDLIESIRHEQLHKHKTNDIYSAFAAASAAT